MFPTIAEYNKVISTQGSNALKSLNVLKFIPSRTVPVKIFSFGAGSYAVVFKANDGFRQYAIRCFISSAEETVMRYRKISNYLKTISASWVTNFELIDDEIFVNDRLYPVLKMDWIDGQLINTYVSQILNNNHEISELQKEIAQVSKSLETNQVGHGDIQCGNILIVKDEMGLAKIKLIDYDGMYIPDFKNQPNLEKGRSEFQHPKRTQYDYNERMDRFPFWVMLTALEALKYDKSLWLEVMQGGFNTLDNFLFTIEDFKTPYNSKLFNRLSQLNQPSLNYYLNKLKAFCSSDISAVTELELFDNHPTTTINITGIAVDQDNNFSESTRKDQSSSINLANAEKVLKLRANLKIDSIDKITKLEMLKESLDSGVLNESEYNKLKSELLLTEESSVTTTENIINQFPEPPSSGRNYKPIIWGSVIFFLLIALGYFLFLNEKNSLSASEANHYAIDTPAAVTVNPNKSTIADSAIFSDNQSEEISFVDMDINGDEIIQLLKSNWDTKEEDLKATSPMLLGHKVYEFQGSKYILVVLGFKNNQDCHACEGVNDVALLEYVNDSYSLIDYFDNAASGRFGGVAEIQGFYLFGPKNVCVALTDYDSGQGSEYQFVNIIGVHDNKLNRISQFYSMEKDEFEEGVVTKEYNREFIFSQNNKQYYDLTINETNKVLNKKITKTIEFDFQKMGYEVKD